MAATTPKRWALRALWGTPTDRGISPRAWWKKRGQGNCTVQILKFRRILIFALGVLN